MGSILFEIYISKFRIKLLELADFSLNLSILKGRQEKVLENDVGEVYYSASWKTLTFAEEFTDL